MSLNLEMLINGGAFVLGIAGATPRRRNGLAWRSARGLRAGQSDGVGLQGSWESLLSPRNTAGEGPHRLIKVQGCERAFRSQPSRKRKRSGVSDAERNAKAREMGRGSLSIFIVAIESGVTHPKEPVSSKGGCRDYGPVA